MSIGRVRPAVAEMASYRPGRAAHQAEEDHGITDAIKLASNENPYPPVASVVEAMTSAASTTNRYADHRAVDLRARLADWLGVSEDSVTVGNGSAELLRQATIAYLDPGDEAVYPWLSFEAYPIMVRMMGGVSVQVPLTESEDADLNAVAGAITDRTKLVFLATPNNPTGTALHTDQLAAFLDLVPEDVVVIIDEAYREFVTEDLGDPITDLLPLHRNVLITRTFSKAFGLAAVRTGYAIGDPEIIADLDKVQSPFAVNSMAQAATIAAIDAVDEFAPLIANLNAERERVADTLIAAGWALPERHANFVYIPLGDRTDDVYLAIEKAGVVTRPFSGAGIRVTIGTPEENDRFLRSFADATS